MSRESGRHLFGGRLEALPSHLSGLAPPQMKASRDPSGGCLVLKGKEGGEGGRAGPKGERNQITDAF